MLCAYSIPTQTCVFAIYCVMLIRRMANSRNGPIATNRARVSSHASGPNASPEVSEAIISAIVRLHKQ